MGILHLQKKATQRKVFKQLLPERGMQSKWYAWGVTLLGVLLLLPKIGVSQLGNLTTGFTSWAIPIIILLVGILGIVKSMKN